jgi:hypothetical protein
MQLEAGPLVAAFLISAVISLVTTLNRLASGSRARREQQTEPHGSELFRRS